MTKQFLCLFSSTHTPKLETFHWGTASDAVYMFHQNTRKHSTVRVTEQWHRLPREMLESPLLEIVKRPRHSPQKSAIGNLP